MLSDSHMSSQDNTYDKNQEDEQDSANQDTAEEEEEEVDSDMTISENDDTGRINLWKN